MSEPREQQNVDSPPQADGDASVRDLPSKEPTQRDADSVRGGLSEIVVSKKVDTSSPSF